MSSTHELLEQLARNMDALNHNSTITAEAVNRIAVSIDKMEEAIYTGFSTNNNEHANIKFLLKYVIGGGLVMLGSLVGVKLALP